VDNGSTDNSVAYVRRAFPTVGVIEARRTSALPAVITSGSGGARPLYRSPQQ